MSACPHGMCTCDCMHGAALRTGQWSMGRGSSAPTGAAWGQPAQPRVRTHSRRRRAAAGPWAAPCPARRPCPRRAAGTRSEAGSWGGRAGAQAQGAPIHLPGARRVLSARSCRGLTAWPGSTCAFPGQAPDGIRQDWAGPARVLWTSPQVPRTRAVALCGTLPS